MSNTEPTYCNGRTDPLDSRDDYPKAEPGPHAGGGYCERPAGWGTPHSGEGRCKLHGGANVDGGRPATHGLYSGRRDELQDRFEQAFGDDRIGSMRAEIAALKALLSDFWERIDDVDADTIDAATKLQGEIRKSLDTASKIADRHAPTEEEVNELMTGVAQLINEYVPESKRADAIADLRALTVNGGRNRLESGGAAD